MMIEGSGKWRLGATGLCLALALAACSSPRKAPAPVVERPVGAARPVPPAVVGAQAPAPALGTATTAVPPVAAPAQVGPGTYVVKSGDTLIRIGLETGQSWRDLARWNNIENPNLIEVGQVLRVVAPAPVVDAGGVVVGQPVATSSVLAMPVPPATTVAGARPTAVVPVPGSAPTVASAPLAPRQEEINWIWPNGGPLLNGFDELKNKGLDIGGKVGDPVVAAADGRVIHAGAGLRGYGNLVIIKHANGYLTAYAHNQALLVKEEQTVAKGQKIAEMGSSDSDRVKLHFEIRNQQGKPLDPVKFLPTR